MAAKWSMTFAFIVFLVQELSTLVQSDTLMPTAELEKPDITGIYPSNKNVDEKRTYTSLKYIKQDKHGILTDKAEALQLPSENASEKKRYKRGYNYFMRPKGGDVSSMIRGRKSYEPLPNLQPLKFNVNEIVPETVKQTEVLDNDKMPTIPPKPVTAVTIEEHTKNEMKAPGTQSPWITLKDEHYEDPKGHFQFHRTVQYANYPPNKYPGENIANSSQMKRQASPQYIPLVQYQNYPHTEEYPENITSMYPQLYQPPSTALFYSPHQNVYSQIPQTPSNQQNVLPEYAHQTSSLQYNPLTAAAVPSYQRIPYAVPFAYPQNLPININQYPIYKNPVNDYLNYPQLLPSSDIQGNNIDLTNSQQGSDYGYQEPLTIIETNQDEMNKRILNYDHENRGDATPKETNFQRHYKGKDDEKYFSNGKKTDNSDQINNKFKEEILLDFETPDYTYSTTESNIGFNTNPEYDPHSSYKIPQADTLPYLSQQQNSQYSNSWNSYNPVYPDYYNVARLQDSSLKSQQADVQALKTWIEEYPNHELQRPIAISNKYQIPTAEINVDKSYLNIPASKPVYVKDYEETQSPLYLASTGDSTARKPKAILTALTSNVNALQDHLADQSLQSMPQESFSLFPNSEIIEPNSIPFNFSKSYPVLPESWDNNAFPVFNGYKFPEFAPAYYKLPSIAETIPEEIIKTAHEQRLEPSITTNDQKQAWYNLPYGKYQQSPTKRQSTLPPVIPKEVHVSSTYTEEIRETTTLTKTTQEPVVGPSGQKPHRVSLPAGAKNIVIKLPNGQDIIIDIEEPTDNSEKVPSTVSTNQKFPINPMTDRLQSYRRSFSFSDPIVSSETPSFDDYVDSSDDSQVLIRPDNTANSSSVFSAAPIAEPPVFNLFPSASVDTTASPIQNSRHFETGENSLGIQTLPLNLGMDFNDEVLEKDSTVLYDSNNNILTISLYKDRHEPSVLVPNENKGPTRPNNLIKSTTSSTVDFNDPSIGHQHQDGPENEEYGSDSTDIYEELPSHNNEGFLEREMDVGVLASRKNVDNRKNSNRNGRHSRFPECKCQCV